jgi:hypothetical protein
MKDPYIGCYLAGRADVFDGDVDLEKLIERAVSPAMVTIRDACLSTAKKAIDGDMDPDTKVMWLKDNLDEIKAMGGDTEKAYRLYVQGRVENLAHQIEVDVITTMEDADDEGDDEDEDDDDDEDEDDDEDGDDEDATDD